MMIKSAVENDVPSIEILGLEWRRENGAIRIMCVMCRVRSKVIYLITEPIFCKFSQ